MAFSLKNNDYPQALGYDLTDPYHYYRTQEIDGKMLLIAGGEDHKTGHEENTGECFSRLENYVRDHFDVRYCILQLVEPVLRTRRRISLHWKASRKQRKNILRLQVSAEYGYDFGPSRHSFYLTLLLKEKINMRIFLILPE
ncbi:hypothetical protein ACFP3I_25635 [Chryseobacterium arachidis]|uniref:hypothetical protein n=1 Tax=Chryseobacterium arachidis TaxID=1416778 RepID=UPI00360F0633